MKLNNWTKRIAKTLFALVAIALMWQSSLFLNPAAMAAPTVLMTTNAAGHVEGAADEVRNRSKDFIRDTKHNVEKTANRNAAKVDESNDTGSYAERKAQRDRDRIERRAEDHAARTEKAVDDSMNAVKGVVENIKDAFGG